MGVSGKISQQKLRPTDVTMLGKIRAVLRGAISPGRHSFVKERGRLYLC